MPRIMPFELQRKRLIDIFKTLNPDVDFRVIDWDKELDSTLTFPEQRKEMARKFPSYKWSGRPEQESRWETWYEEYEEDIERRQIEAILSERYGLKPVSEEVAQIAESIMRAGLKPEDVGKLSKELEEAIRTIAFERLRVEDLENKLKAEQAARAKVEAERRALPAVRMEEIRRREEELKKREAQVQRWAEELTRAQFGLKARTEAVETTIEKVKPPPAPPVKELSLAERRALEELFTARLKVQDIDVTKYLTKFEELLEAVEMLPYDLAHREVLKLVEDIIFEVKRAPRVARRVEVGVPAVILPLTSPSTQPFPRRVVSEEKDELERLFRENVPDWSDWIRALTRDFYERTFSSWEDLKSQFEKFIQEIVEGTYRPREVVKIPPAVYAPPEEQVKYFASAGYRPSYIVEATELPLEKVKEIMAKHLMDLGYDRVTVSIRTELSLEEVKKIGG